MPPALLATAAASLFGRAGCGRCCVVGLAGRPAGGGGLRQLGTALNVCRPHLSNHHGLLRRLGSGGDRQGSSGQRGHGGSLRAGSAQRGRGVSAAGEANGGRSTHIAPCTAAGARCRGARGPGPPAERGRGAGSSGCAAAGLLPHPRTFCSAFTACTRTACTRAGRLALLRCTPLRRPQGLVTSAVCMLSLLGIRRQAGGRRWRRGWGCHQAHLMKPAHPRGHEGRSKRAIWSLRGLVGRLSRVWPPELCAAPPARSAPSCALASSFSGHFCIYHD